MSGFLLKSVNLNGKIVDVLIRGNRFARIVDSISPEEYAGIEVVDCRNFAILPAFYNAHTHAAMTLLRGYADDMPLQKWLQEYIWPFEAKLTVKDIEIGSRLAVLEMIKSGTVFFADMYWQREATMKVVEEMGIRACIGVTIAEHITTPEGIEANFRFLQEHKGVSERVQLAVMPHSVYMVGEPLLRRCADVAKSEKYVLHTHLSETMKEVEDCRSQNGCSPTELFEKVGAMDVPFVAAHCVHLSENDRTILKNSGATIALNPASNMKLSSGIPAISTYLDEGLKLALGTDGASSNNNLDMGEEMKLAALLAKIGQVGRADVLSAEDALHMATRAGAQAFGLNAGVIAEGALADCLLVRLDNERMVPSHHIVSNWVYGADSCAIDSVICNGKFVMHNRHVDGEEDIVAEAQTCANRLAAK